MTTETIENGSNTLASYRVLLNPKLPEEIIALRGFRHMTLKPKGTAFLTAMVKRGFLQTLTLTDAKSGSGRQALHILLICGKITVVGTRASN